MAPCPVRNCGVAGNEVIASAFTSAGGAEGLAVFDQLQINVGNREVPGRVVGDFPHEKHIAAVDHGLAVDDTADPFGVRLDPNPGLLGGLGAVHTRHNATEVPFSSNLGHG